MTGLERKARLAVNLLFVIVAAVAMVATVYIGSSPKQYDLQIGDVSAYDISAPRDFADNAETMRRALEAMAQVPNVMIRSEELSDASSDTMRQLLKTIQEKRDELYKEPVISVVTEPGNSDPGQTSPPDEIRPRRPDNHAITHENTPVFG